jgi:RNA polymerase sigma-70 factor (ECF subfamily)
MEAVAFQSKKTFRTDDGSLIALAIGGQQAAYSQLMERYREAVFHTVFKIVPNKDDADDLTMEAFCKAFNSLGSYRPTFSFSTWLFRIAINHGIDFLRKRKMQVFSIDQPMDPETAISYKQSLTDGGLDPEDQLILQEQYAQVRSLVAQLTGRYRLMIEMRYFEGLAYAEIAEELNVSVGTVKAQLFRARAILREMWEEEKADEAFGVEALSCH